MTTSTTIELDHVEPTEKHVTDQKTTALDPHHAKDSIPDFGSFWIDAILISLPRLRKAAFFYCFVDLVVSCVSEFLAPTEYVASVVARLSISTILNILNAYLVWKYQLHRRHIQSWFLLFTLLLAPLTPIMIGSPKQDTIWMCGFASILVLLIGISFWKQRSQLLQYLIDQEKSNSVPPEPNSNEIPLQSGAQETIQTPGQIYAHGEPPPYTVFVPETDHVEANTPVPGRQRPFSVPILKSPDSVSVPVSSEVSIPPVATSNPSTSSALVSSSTVTQHASTSKQQSSISRLPEAKE